MIAERLDFLRRCRASGMTKEQADEMWCDRAEAEAEAIHARILDHAKRYGGGTSKTSGSQPTGPAGHESYYTCRPGSHTPGEGPKLKRKGPIPPAHLSSEVKAWWRSVIADFDLEAHHQHLLRLACESWDRCQSAREILATEGVVFRDDRGNPRAHPAVAIEKDARTSFARLLRELDLDVEPPSAQRRSPGLRSNRG